MGSFSYNYDRDNINGHKLYEFTFRQNEFEPIHIARYLVSPQDNFEAMARACSTWGKAAGASDKVGGAIEEKVNLGADPYQLPGEKPREGFGDEHSGQFTARIQNLTAFYDTLLKKLDLKPNP